MCFCTYGKVSIRNSNMYKNKTEHQFSKIKKVLLQTLYIWYYA